MWALNILMVLANLPASRPSYRNVLNSRSQLCGAVSSLTVSLLDATALILTLSTCAVISFGVILIVVLATSPTLNSGTYAFTSFDPTITGVGRRDGSGSSRCLLRVSDFQADEIGCRG